MDYCFFSAIDLENLVSTNCQIVSKLQSALQKAALVQVKADGMP